MDNEFNGSQNEQQQYQPYQQPYDTNMQQFSKQPYTPPPQQVYQQPVDPISQQYAQPPYQQPYVPPQFPPQNDYGYVPYGEPPEKRAYMGLLLGIIIVLLVAIIGVLGYICFFKGSNNKSSSEKLPAAMTAAPATEDIQPETDEPDITTSAAITSRTTTAAVTTTTTASSDSPIKNVSVYPSSDIRYYPQFKEAVEDDIANGVFGFMINSDYATAPGYALIDLNEDGTPELVTYAYKGYIVNIFAISGSKAVNLDSVGGGFRDSIVIYPDGSIIHSGSGGANSGGATCFKYKGGNRLTDQYSYTYEYPWEPGEGETKYTYTENGTTRRLDESEFKAISTFLGDPVEPNPTPLSDMGITVTKKPKETYLYRGYVATEKDPLNMRETPDTNGKVIAQLPKGTKGSVYTVDGVTGWYKFYPDGRTDYGYVSAQYIKEDK